RFPPGAPGWGPPHAGKSPRLVPAATPPRRVRQPPETPSTCSSYSHGHLFREVAGGAMVARLLFQGRLQVGTRRRDLGDGAARMKPAAGWGVDRRRYLPAEVHDPSFGLNVRIRDGNR